VAPSHLMDTKLHDFKSIKVTGVPHEDGDKAFDTETFPAATPSTGLASLKVVQA
jgi:tRNA 2-thiocytidine biosynthesis protein TtcA